MTLLPVVRIPCAFTRHRFGSQWQDTVSPIFALFPCLIEPRHSSRSEQYGGETGEGSRVCRGQRTVGTVPSVQYLSLGKEEIGTATCYCNLLVQIIWTLSYLRLGALGCNY